MFSLYRTEEDSWLSGLKLDNPVIADAKYNIRHVGNGNTGGVSFLGSTVQRFYDVAKIYQSNSEQCEEV